jgi:glycosyltransferase involved in cell wall biosynthesis
MHILILNSEFPPVGGGAGTASAQIAHSLVAAGHRVTVMTTRFGDLPAEDQCDGYNIIRLPARRRHLHRSSASEQLHFMLVAALRGLPHMRRLRPDAVLAFFGAPSGAAAWFWSFFMQLPYIVSLRGGDVPGFRPYDFAREHTLLKPLLRRVWRRAIAVVANSRGLRQLGADFEPRVPIAVIPNGVDMAAFAVEERQWQPPRLLFVGRIVYQKGLDTLLDALSQLTAADWELRLVGDGPQLPRLRTLARQYDLNERVHFLGWQDRSALPRLLAESNLFVYPSRHEGMPNAVLEAMASGLPVIATAIAGNEELVKSGFTGLLVPPEDIGALAAALAELLPDARRREDMGAAARRLVSEDYSWQNTADAYMDLFERAVEHD